MVGVVSREVRAWTLAARSDRETLGSLPVSSLRQLTPTFQTSATPWAHLIHRQQALTWVFSGALTRPRTFCPGTMILLASRCIALLQPPSSRFSHVQGLSVQPPTSST